MNKQVRFACALASLSLIAILATALTQANAADVGPVVKTKSGKVSGTTVEDGGEKAHIFKGIPYAAPPVDEWRWKAPQPVKPWSDVLAKPDRSAKIVYTSMW
jgi:para-nitrobenzyl esterase